MRLHYTLLYPITYIFDDYKKHLCFQPGVKPVEIWTMGSIPIVNQILSNPKKGGKPSILLY